MPLWQNSDFAFRGWQIGEVHIFARLGLQSLVCKGLSKLISSVLASDLQSARSPSWLRVQHGTGEINLGRYLATLAQTGTDFPLLCLVSFRSYLDVLSATIQGSPTRYRFPQHISEKTLRRYVFKKGMGAISPAFEANV